MQLVARPIHEPALRRLVEAGVSPLFARLFAARGVLDAAELNLELGQLLPPDTLKNVEDAAKLLAAAIAADKKMVIVADYDCDGATACAVGVRGLRLFGAKIEYVVPNRFEYGYGLTPEIVRLTHERFRPDLIITVDNGIASVEGALEARRLGIDVLVTDHHLAADVLPEAACIVNPNQPGCRFPSKHLAGVGVMFYVLLALRAHLRALGAYREAPQPRLDSLLGLVALGTVADVVRLDPNNRRLVAQGLQRIQAGRTQPGITALFLAAGRQARLASVHDLGFALGPRLNAAGRLADMALGIECLLTDDFERALEIAQQLDAINRERRGIEEQMQTTALELVERLGAESIASHRASLCLYDAAWHQGVVGILASRLKDRFHRPTVAFAPNADGTLRGSGRSILGLHLRDVLDLVSKRHPGLIQRFGGHAMAAGLTIEKTAFDAFSEAFEAAVSATLDPKLLARTLEVDGPLDDAEATAATARAIAAEVWGQGFAIPLFCNEFMVVKQQVLQDKHLKLVLRSDAGRSFEAIWFNHCDALPPRARLAYRLAEDSFRGVARLQLVIEQAEAA
ncbi:MAG: single-stranded-DNA-specific exonuclease RecJ [Burkholderiaceae bacterium]